VRKKTLINVVVTVVAALAAGALGVVGGICYERSQTVTAGGQPRAERILPLLKHRDPNVRRAAIEVLKVVGKGEPACFDALRAAASGDEDPIVRHTAFDAVAGSGGRAATDFLLKSLRSSEPAARQQAARQLGRMKERRAFDPLTRLFEAEIRRRSPARGMPRHELRVVVEAMANINPRQTLPYALRALRASPGDYGLRRVVARAATPEEAPALADFASKLAPAEYSAHLAVIEAFRKLRSKSAVPYLTKQLENKHAAVRGEAARALSYTAGREAFEPLAAALRREVSDAAKLPESRPPAGASRWFDPLRNINDPRACAVFLEVARTAKHSQVRVSAARAMRVCVDPALGPKVYALWKQTKEAPLKSMLKLVLQHAPGYGYRWDEKARDFKPRAEEPKPRPKAPAPKPPAKAPDPEAGKTEKF
jgi:HEAT repeat protein